MIRLARTRTYPMPGYYKGKGLQIALDNSDGDLEDGHADNTLTFTVWYGIADV